MLDGIEKTSLTWRTLMDWIDSEIDDARDQNENPQLTPEMTLALRTHVATLRRIKALTDQPRALAAPAVPLDAR